MTKLQPRFDEKGPSPSLENGGVVSFHDSLTHLLDALDAKIRQLARR